MCRKCDLGIQRSYMIFLKNACKPLDKGIIGGSQFFEISRIFFFPRRQGKNTIFFGHPVLLQVSGFFSRLPHLLSEAVSIDKNKCMRVTPKCLMANNKKKEKQLTYNANENIKKKG